MHICLAGGGITRLQALVEAISADHDVTLVSDATRLERSAVLECSHVIVLDAGGLGPRLRTVLTTVHGRRPEVPIVLVDGGLTEDDKADAFGLGVLDYFASPCCVELLVERLEVLGRPAVESRIC